MTTAMQRSVDVSPSTMAALVLAIFTVSAGFGIVLPLLPDLIERLLGDGVGVTQVSRHTGLLTGIYAFSLFLFAPAWGRLSDYYSPRIVLLVGLFGFGATMLAFSFIENFTAVYAERFLNGMFASAVTPVAAAVIGELTISEDLRCRRLALLSMSGIGGFLLGPMLGVLITRLATDVFTIGMPAGSLSLPLTATALFAFVVAIIVACVVPERGTRNQPRKERAGLANSTSRLIPKLLILSFVVSAGVGVFEVGLVLLGKQVLSLTPYQIALMFTECSLVMFAIQAIIFFSPWVKPNTTRWFIAPAFGVLALGLFVVPWASDFILMLVVIGAVAASAGILSPILTYWISAKSGNAQGWELGKQTAAASLGVTVGSVAGGMFFNLAVPGTSFIIAAGLTVLGFLLSYGLPQTLLPRRNIGMKMDTEAKWTGEYTISYLVKRKEK